MKKHIFLSLTLGLLLTFQLSATVHNIGVDGLTYTPATLEAMAGDTVNFTISANHPTVQVSEATWNANGTTQAAGGFGPFNDNFTIILTNDMSPTIYYVCSNHVGAGMKGIINITTVGIQELAYDLDFSIKSNPVINNLLEYTINEVEFTQMQLSVFDIEGKLVSTDVISNKNGSVPMNVETGIYLIQLIDNNGKLVYTDRLLVE